MCRWAIVISRQMLFCTDDQLVAKRFLALSFQVYDHLNGCYTFIDHKETDARDLLSEADYLNYWQSDQKL